MLPPPMTMASSMSQLLDLRDLLGKFLDDLGRDVITTAFFAKGLATQF